MRGLPNSAIAQLLFVDEPYMNFARLVGEIDLHLAKCVLTGHRLGWDCEDVAWFDVGVCRLLVARADPAPAGYALCLTIAAGPSPHRSFEDRCSLSTSDSYRFCRSLVDSVQRLYTADTILWQESSGLLDADLIDVMAELIPPRIEIESDPVVVPDAQILADPVARGEVANDYPHIPAPDIQALRRIRNILYTPDEPEQISREVRMAGKAFTCTLMMVNLPVGIAVMAHGMFRGESPRLAARAMALTGTAVALWHAGLASGVAAFL